MCTSEYCNDVKTVSKLISTPFVIFGEKAAKLNLM